MRPFGLAGNLGSAFLAFWAFALVMMAVGAVFVLRGDFAAIAFFGFAWLGGALALLVLGLALVAAALGLGHLPRLAIAAAGTLELAALGVSVASLPVTSERGVVAAVAVLGGTGALASIVAWLRTGRGPWGTDSSLAPKAP